MSGKHVTVVEGKGISSNQKLGTRTSGRASEQVNTCLSLQPTVLPCQADIHVGFHFKALYHVISIQSMLTYFKSNF